MFKFKKIASILASTVMLSSTVAFAAASTYPAPFVSSGTSDVAVVYGGPGIALTDVVAASDVSNNLANTLISQTTTTTTTTTTSGEVTPLFSGGTKLYLNDSLTGVKSVLSKTELPIVLADESFSGNADATVSQSIVLGSNPIINFAKQPTSSNDPDFGIALSTNTANYLYNATATFSKAVNLTHADSEGQELKLFGQTYTIAAATDATDLVLLKSAQKLTLTNDANTQDVTIGGKTYTVKLVSASDTSATLEVTDSDGNSDSKTINEAASKKIQGLTIAVDTADETNFQLSATIIAGAEKIKMTSGSAVSYGESDTVIDGTKVTFSGGLSAPNSLTKIVISVAAPSSDEDAIKAGGSFVDPVFGSFKFDFPTINSPANSTTRENIKVSSSGDDKMTVELTEHRGNSKEFQFAANNSAMGLYVDSDNKNISVMERTILHKGDYVTVGNEDEGFLLKLTTVTNATAAVTGDRVIFTDVFSGATYETVWTTDGIGTVNVLGKGFDVKMDGTQGAAEDIMTVTLGYPDTTAATNAVVYPTIQTSKGAKVAFYKPLRHISLHNFDSAANTLSTVSFPDGDGYTTATLADAPGAALLGANWSVYQGTTLKGNVSTVLSRDLSQVNVTIGELTFAFTGSDAANTTDIYLVAPPGGSPVGGIITDPALIIWEEKDDNADYRAMIVTLEAGASGDDGMGVEDVIRTWGADVAGFEHTMASDSKKTMETDLWGSLITLDAGDSDQKKLTISYPDEQVYANVYVGEDTASITTGGGGATGTAGNILLYADSEVIPTDKNLIVIGGSCINAVAATLLGSTSPICGADFTTTTGVGSGEFLIQTFSRTGGKVATLVAGYNAGDTINAAKYLTTQTGVDTTSGKKYKGTSATSAEIVTTTTTATTNTTTNTTG